MDVLVMSNRGRVLHSIVRLMRRACCFDGERVSCILLSVRPVSRASYVWGRGRGR